MNIKLELSGQIKPSTIQISGSKSETNRLLLLRALFDGVELKNSSDSDDSVVMLKALKSEESVIDVHHAGTAMRFLTAYFAVTQGKKVVLTGSQRMKERPVQVLVDALRYLGAQIEYLGETGYPPIEIAGQKIAIGKLAIRANVSSQYITALLLIAGKLENGLELVLEGEITSMPYIKMTLGLLNEIGIEARLENDCIVVKPVDEPLVKTVEIESDWSSASYFYSIVALAEPETEITLSSYKQKSLQGDSTLVEIYRQLGVETLFNGNAITLKRVEKAIGSIFLNLNNTPDIVQTIAVTCFGLGIGCHLTGLHTLKIKETDRLEALRAELTKLGALISVTNDTLILKPSLKINQDVSIETYNDHRMAMAFAPLAVRVPVVIIDAGVVSKSYPAFWDDLKRVGIGVQTL